MAMGKFKLALKDYELVSDMCNVVDREITHVYVYMHLSIALFYFSAQNMYVMIL